MYYHQNIDGCFSNVVGPSGIEEDFLQRYYAPLQEGIAKLKFHHEQGTLPFLKLPYLRKDLKDLERIVLRFQDEFTDVVVLGTGGSSLGAQAFCALSSSATPRLHFMSNVDPDTFEKLFTHLKPCSTGFLVVSKSGSTAETLMQFATCLALWSEWTCASSVKDHFKIITEPKSSPLRRLADKWEIPCLDHDPDLGGRFSALSLVGLLPAMISGMDAIQIREGASYVLESLFHASGSDMGAPAIGAAIAASLAQKKKSISVMMPYVDRLALFSEWYRQLWAESIGKKGMGTTPVDALGTVDQHSQLQLYLDGPKDKYFNLLVSKAQGAGRRIALDFFEDPDFAYMAGHTMGDLLEAEQQATIDTLRNNQCPTRVLTLNAVDEPTIGALMMHFMLETTLTAEIWKLNPYDQPAVEESKILTRKYLKNMPIE
jgi:glucose-6-phosphate isomerase